MVSRRGAGTQRKGKNFFFGRYAGRAKRLFLPRIKPEITEKGKNKGKEWFRAE